MAEFKLKTYKTNFEEITLNEHGDMVVVSADDPTLFDRFVLGYKRIIEMADSVQGKLSEIEKEYEGKEEFSSLMGKVVAMSGVNVDFSKEAAEIIDSIFGAGTIRKRFYDYYEKIPDFLPDADMFIEFMDVLLPIMEKIFDCKMERQEKTNKARMAKYQPQDYKKPQRKSAK